MKARLNYYQRIIALFLAVTLAYATVTLVYALAQISTHAARENVLAAERLLAVASTSVDGLLARVRSTAVALQTDPAVLRYATNTRPEAEASCAVDAATAVGRVRQNDQAFAIRLAKRGSATLLGDPLSSDLHAYLSERSSGRVTDADIWRATAGNRAGLIVFGGDAGPVTPGRAGALLVAHQSHPYIQDGILMLFELSPEALFGGVRGIRGVRLVMESDGREVAASAPPLGLADRAMGAATGRSGVAPVVYRLEYNAASVPISGLTTLAGPFLLFLLLCALGIWLSRMISVRLYAPVRRLLHALEEDRSTADSFEAAISMAEEFKKVNGELRSLAEESRLSLRDAFVRDALLGTMDPEEVPLGIIRHGVELLRGPVIVCVCGVDDSPGTDLAGDERAYTIRQRLLSLFGVLMRQDGNLLTVGKDGSSSYFLFNGADPSAVRRRLRRALDTMEKEHGFRMYAAVSDPVCSSAALPEAAQAVRALSLNSRLRRTYRLLSADQARAVDHGTVSYSHDQEGQLIAAVTEMDHPRTRRLLRMIVEDNTGAGEDLVDALGITVTRIWLLSGMPASAPVCPSLDGDTRAPAARIVAWFDALMTSLAARDGEDRQTRKGEFLRYVEERYRENVGLSEMAEALNMSMGYASSLFRELVGVNFKDYLRAYRIREAKRILESEEVLVKDLARRVGYLNTQTFIRAFMKEAGLPPGQYMHSVSRGGAGRAS